MVTRAVPSPLPEQLRGLLDIGRALRSGGDLEPVLSAIAAGLQRATGFRAVVINLRRPEWDDFEVVVSLGDEEACAALLGETTTWADWAPFLVLRNERAGAYFIPAGTTDWSSEIASAGRPARVRRVASSISGSIRSSICIDSFFWGERPSGSPRRA